MLILVLTRQDHLLRLSTDVWALKNLLEVEVKYLFLLFYWEFWSRVQTVFTGSGGKISFSFVLLGNGATGTWAGIRQPGQGGRSLPGQFVLSSNGSMERAAGQGAHGSDSD